MNEKELFKAVDNTTQVLYVRDNDDYNHGVGDALECMLRYFGVYKNYCERGEK